jgi:two-component system OmpR family sensor kinase
LQALQRPGDEAARRIAVERLAMGIDRASRLIEQLLSMARHDAAATQTPPRRLELVQLMRQAISDILPDANAKAMDIGMDGVPEAWVRGDPDALALLARNLLDNAIKYTPAEGRIDVGIEIHDDAATLIVDDSGPGIPPAERERVFDRFYRAQNHDAVGSGLGLSIVDAVARRHDAAIFLEDAPHLGGLRVRVRFPLSFA